MLSGSCAVRPHGTEVPNAMSLMLTYFRGVTWGRPIYEALREGHKVAPLYLSRNISATPERRNGKLCTRLHKYLSEVMCKFDANLFTDDVTMTSEIKPQIALFWEERCNFVTSLIHDITDCWSER